MIPIAYEALISLLIAVHAAYEQASLNDSNCKKLQQHLAALENLLQAIKADVQANSAIFDGAFLLLGDALKDADDLVRAVLQLGMGQPRFALGAIKAYKAAGLLQTFECVNRNLQNAMTSLIAALGLANLQCQRAEAKQLMDELSKTIFCYSEEERARHDRLVQLVELCHGTLIEHIEEIKTLLGGVASAKDVAEMRENMKLMKQQKDDDGQKFMEQMIEVAQYLSLADASSSRHQAEHPIAEASSSLDGADPPEKMTCPITLKLMWHPVMLVASGTMFERSAIERHVAQQLGTRKPLTCPVTCVAVTQPLGSQLVNAHDFMDTIKEWCVRTGHPLPSPPDAAGVPSLVAILQSNNLAGRLAAARALESLALYNGNEVAIASAGAIPFLVALLQNADTDAQLTAARALRSLAGDADNQAAIASAGAIPPLVALLQNTNTETAMTASFALLRMAGHAYNRGAIADAGAIPLLVAHLRNLNPEMQLMAVHALLRLAAHAEILAAILNAGAIPPLLALLQSANPKAQQTAANALRNFAAHANNKVAIARAGAIPPLVALLQNFNPHTQETAANALRKLAGDANNQVAIANAGAIPPLVALLQSGNPETQQAAANALRKLTGDADNRVAIANAGAIPVLVALQHSSNSAKQHAAARALRSLAGDANNQVVMTT